MDKVFDIIYNFILLYLDKRKSIKKNIGKNNVRFRSMHIKT